MTKRIGSNEYQALLQQPMRMEEFNATVENSYLLVDASIDSAAEIEPKPALLPACPVVGIGFLQPSDAFDVLLDDASELDLLLPNLTHQPLACTVLVQLLRNNAVTPATHGLFAESLAYSTLQQSRGFQAWLASGQRRRGTPDHDDVLLLTREEDALTITLNRPAAHNAYNMALKDALCEALQLAHADPTVHSVSLAGNGPSFCAGGDLSEFGQVTDAALAHVSRTTRSAGSLLAHLTCRTEAHLHGACIGAGIEIPAFAKHITAVPETFFQLPEVTMGLVPGAGGTVSITRRIGRHRAAYMAMAGQRVDAATALAWGLIDAIKPR